MYAPEPRAITGIIITGAAASLAATAPPPPPPPGTPPELVQPGNSGEEPSLEEVGMAFDALRAHAAPGSNGIAAIQGGEGAMSLIHGAIAAVWRKGEAPAAWKDVGMGKGKGQNPRPQLLQGQGSKP